MAMAVIQGTYSMHKFELNLSPKKTAAVLSLGGEHSEALASQISKEQLTAIPCTFQIGLLQTSYRPRLHPRWD